MVPMPMLDEKKACPRASNTVVPVTLEKSGLNRNFRPSLAPDRVTERTAMIMTTTKSRGISILEYFSMPFFMPVIRIPAVRTRNSIVKSCGRKGDAVTSRKKWEVALLSGRLNVSAITR